MMGSTTCRCSRINQNPKACGSLKMALVVQSRPCFLATIDQSGTPLANRYSYRNQFQGRGRSLAYTRSSDNALWIGRARCRRGLTSPGHHELVEYTRATLRVQRPEAIGDVVHRPLSDALRSGLSSETTRRQTTRGPRVAARKDNDNYVRRCCNNSTSVKTSIAFWRQ